MDKTRSREYHLIRTGKFTVTVPLASNVREVRWKVWCWIDLDAYYLPKARFRAKATDVIIVLLLLRTFMFRWNHWYQFWRCFAFNATLAIWYLHHESPRWQRPVLSFEHWTNVSKRKLMNSRKYHSQYGLQIWELVRYIFCPLHVPTCLSRKEDKG